jgi:hypothetical protein
LKEGVYNNTLNNRNFYQLINELSNHRITQASIDFFHDLRNLYNSLKHDPNFTTYILNCINVLKNSLKSLNEIELQNIGNIHGIYSQQKSRIVWIAGWDDYIGGMTEMGIFLPDYELDFPVGIEHFNIDWKGWDEIKDTFVPTGELELGKEFISERAYNMWKAQSDFLGAGRFKGDIAQLIKVISNHINSEKEEQLLEGLKRKNDSSSVRAAIVFSLHDSFVDNTWSSFEDLKDEIKMRSSYDYGISIDSKVIDKYLMKLNLEIGTIDRLLFESVNEIKWVDETGFKKEEVVLHLIEESFISINGNNQIICRIK